MIASKIQHIDQWFDGPTESPLLIAGPCSVESPEQILATAQALKTHTPISLLRGGVWKPRTKPGSFEGVGLESMQWLIDAGRAIGTPTTTEVANTEHVEAALKAGIDILWIGARTTVNPFYVQEIAEALKGVKILVLVKNPIHAEIGLWAGAIERFKNAGIEHVAAVHRGFFTSAKGVYRNEPHWHHSFGLRALMPEIKVIVDPSHIAGKRLLVPEVCQVAMDLGMDGLMVESHISPEIALSDAAQQMNPEKLGAVVKNLVIHPKKLDQGASEALKSLRDSLDELDDNLVDIMRQRFALAKEIAIIKEQEGTSIFQMERWLKLVKERTERGDGEGLTPEFMHDLFATIHKYSVEYQTRLTKKES